MRICTREHRSVLAAVSELANPFFLFLLASVACQCPGSLCGLFSASARDDGVFGKAGGTLDDEVQKVQALLWAPQPGKLLQAWLPPHGPVARKVGRLWACGGEEGGDTQGRDLRGGLRSGCTGGRRRLPKRLGVVTVGYKCH